MLLLLVGVVVGVGFVVFVGCGSLGVERRTEQRAWREESRSIFFRDHFRIGPPWHRWMIGVMIMPLSKINDGFVIKVGIGHAQCVFQQGFGTQSSVVRHVCAVVIAVQQYSKVKRDSSVRGARIAQIKR